MLVEIERTFEAAHRLHGHSGRCQFIHGHTYTVVIRARGLVGTDGMVIDFHSLRERVTAAIEPWDHALILQESDPVTIPLLSALVSAGGQDGRVVVVPFRPTAENMARHLFRLISQSIPLESVSVQEGRGGTATATIEDCA